MDQSKRPGHLATCGADCEKNHGGRPKSGKRPTLSEQRVNEGYYSHRDVADMLGIHPNTVHKLTRINKIPVERREKGIGGHHDLFYPKDAIHALRDKLSRGVTGSALKEVKAQNPIKQINGVESLYCENCNTDVPLEEAVMHERGHRTGNL